MMSDAHIPKHLLYAYFQLMVGSEINIIFNGEICPPIKCNRGIKQGRADSMRLWCQTVMHHVQPIITPWKSRRIGGYIGDNWMPLVGYADDINIIANDYEHVHIMLREFVGALQKIGLSLSQDNDKCAFMVVAPDVAYPNEIHVNGYKFIRKKQMKILGSFLDDNNDLGPEISNRISRGTK
eukprot:2404446-Karenia_brevis.AAC.1